MSMCRHSDGSDGLGVEEDMFCLVSLVTVGLMAFRERLVGEGVGGRSESHYCREAKEEEAGGSLRLPPQSHPLYFYKDSKGILSSIHPSQAST